ncbi:MAG: hypothetical protein GQ569_06825 [Methylococcaceae bacterium]|nr:hypothetical protein [Methylococcaceae bacterium]
MNMTKCPQCGNQRNGEEYKCPKCDCYYSELDEILATEKAELEKRSIKGRLNAIRAADDSMAAFKKECLRVKENTPKIALFSLALIVMFIFTMTLSVML